MFMMNSGPRCQEHWLIQFFETLRNGRVWRRMFCYSLMHLSFSTGCVSSWGLLMKRNRVVEYLNIKFLALEGHILSFVLWWDLQDLWAFLENRGLYTETDNWTELSTNFWNLSKQLAYSHRLQMVSIILTKNESMEREINRHTKCIKTNGITNPISWERLWNDKKTIALEADT